MLLPRPVQRALHTFLRTLYVLGRLDALVEVMALEKDAREIEATEIGAEVAQAVDG